MNRREFLATNSAAILAPKRAERDQISLAAWSINQSFFRAKKWTNLELPKITKDLGIDGVEFVNQFFENPTLTYLQRLKKAGADAGVKFVLIMVDSEGDMASPDAKLRQASAIAHRKWVDVAHEIGCHAIRCNLGGPRTGWEQDQDLVKRASESFADLLRYSDASGLNIVIENHGGASSHGDTLASLMKTVNNPRFGTLPDFGNLNPGDKPEEVIPKIVPWAKGISVKASWTEDGTHPRYDLAKIINICKDAGYRGFWGIESGMAGRSAEGATPEQIWDRETKAIVWTRDVLKKTLGI